MLYTEYLLCNYLILLINYTCQYFIMSNYLILLINYTCQYFIMSNFIVLHCMYSTTETNFYVETGVY